MLTLVVDVAQVVIDPRVNLVGSQSA
jgi:hypothetical protein